MSLLLTPAYQPLWAAQFIIKRDRVIRAPVTFANGKQDYTRVGYLKAGSIVEVPDEFLEIKRDASGKPRLDSTLSLNNWYRHASELKRAGIQVKNANRDGRVRIEGSKGGPVYGDYDGYKKTYFFPVKLVGAAKNSSFKSGFKPQDFYIELNQLVGQGGVQFATEKDLELYQAKNKESDKGQPQDQQAADKTKETANDKNAEATAKTKDSAETKAAQAKTEAAQSEPVCDYCQKNRDPVFALEEVLAPHLRIAQDRTEKKTTQFIGNSGAVQRNFKEYCGIEYSKFEELMTKETKNVAGVSHEVANELLKSILVSESSGVGFCQSVNSDDDKGGSWGLFQVSAGSSSNKACQEIAKKEGSLKSNKHSYKDGSAYMKNLVACQTYMANPINNLHEAIKILNEKSKELFVGNRFSPAVLDVNKMSKPDQMRFLLSAYNGGVTYIRAAVGATDKFNQTTGAKLDRNKWEDVRLSYFRIYVSSKQDPTFYGAKKWHRVYDRSTGKTTNQLDIADRQRGRESTLINLAYVETIIPRDGLNKDKLRKADGDFMQLVAQPVQASTNSK